MLPVSTRTSTKTLPIDVYPLLGELSIIRLQHCLCRFRVSEGFIIGRSAAGDALHQSKHCEIQHKR